MDMYPDTFAVVEYFVDNLPWSLPWGEARGDFYNIWGDGIPWFAYDGLFDAWPISSYHQKFVNRQAISTDVGIEISATQLSADTWRFMAELCVETGGEAKPARIYMVQVLDHWPPASASARNTFKQAAETEDVQLNPGLCTMVMRDFTFDADSMAQIEDVKIVVWAQTPNNGIPAEIFQGKVCAYPFVSNPADVNGDGVVNVLDLNLVLAAWGATSGPEDINGDGIVNVLDLLEIIAAWG